MNINIKKVVKYIRSSVFPAICVGSRINWERFKLKMVSQSLTEAGERPHRESQLMSPKLKSPSNSKLLAMHDIK